MDGDALFEASLAALDRTTRERTNQSERDYYAARLAVEQFMRNTYSLSAYDAHIQHTEEMLAFYDRMIADDRGQERVFGGAA